MSKYPISVKPEISFETVVCFMPESRFSTLWWKKKTRCLSVYSQREGSSNMLCLVKLWTNALNRELIQPFVSVTPNTTVIETAKLMISKKSRILVFADIDKLVGTTTASDMLRTFGRWWQINQHRNHVVIAAVCMYLSGAEPQGFKPDESYLTRLNLGK